MKRSVPPPILNPKAESRSAPGRGEGLFAVAPIAAGETIVEWTGVETDGAGLARCPPRIRANSLQVGPDRYLVPEAVAPGDHVNHSCAPNAGLRGDRTLVAMRDIAAGEEIGYDYAMSDSEPYDEFDCRCGAPQCRGRVRGDDWKRPELQARYRGFFAPHVQTLIDRG